MPRAREILGSQTEVIDEEGDSELEKHLSYREMEHILIDIKNCTNHRPLLYQGEAFEQPVLTPNILLRGKPTPNVEEDLETIGEEKVSRRMKFLQRSKEYFRRRFLKEYAHALGERKSNSTEDNPKNSRHRSSGVIEK